MNYKGIPYKTEWTEYNDIEKIAKEKGIPPSGGINPETGGPYYTLPAIVDESTRTALSDSFRIAEYLDKAYPDTPKVIIPGTESLQAAFIGAFRPHLKAMWQFVLPATLDMIDNPESKEYFYRTRSSRFGKDLKTMKPTGDAWQAGLDELRDGLDNIDQWLLRSGGPYVMGDTTSFADFVLGGCLKWMQVALQKDSKEWKQISSWNDGRWGERVERLEKYGQTH